MSYLEFYSQYVHRYVKDIDISGDKEIYYIIIYIRVIVVGKFYLEINDGRQ